MNFASKWLGGYQVQSSRFMAQEIVLVIINAMISFMNMHD